MTSQTTSITELLDTLLRRAKEDQEGLGGDRGAAGSDREQTGRLIQQSVHEPRPVELPPISQQDFEAQQMGRKVKMLGRRR